MQKHLFIIQAHNQAELLCELVKALDSENHSFIIHIDKKSKGMLCNPQIIQLKEKNNCCVISSYSIRWGGVSQFLSTIEMLNIAEQEYDFDWLHFISGVDFPAKSNRYIDEYFEKSTYKAFMGFDKAELYNLYLKKRLMTYHLDDLITHKLFNYVLTELQVLLVKLGIPLRSKFKYQVFKGSNWFSWNKEVVNYVVKFNASHPEYLRRFKWSTRCDEVFFHTIVMNSEHKKDVFPRNLRFVDWKAKVPGEHLPRTLDASDYDAVAKDPEILFCRKLDWSISKELIKKLRNKTF